MHALLRMTAATLGLTAAAHLAAQPLPPVRDTAYPGVITVDVDATDLDHKIFKVKQTVPVKAGPLTLLYPRWIPGHHSPTGAVQQIAALKISAGGKPVDWLRNTLDTHAFQVEVPSGASALEIEFQYLSPIDGAGRTVMTPDMLNLQWDAMLLYPAGHAVSRINVKASATLPTGWEAGTALETAGRSGAKFDFKPVSVETLVDSPIFAGKNFQRFDLDPGAREAGRAPVTLNVMADRASQIKVSDAQLAAHRALVTQADKVFNSRHYAHYDFLLLLSDELGHIGLEHHESSENGVKPTYFTEWEKNPIGRDLLPHEYTHSWDGKFRRPADLLTPNYNVPMQDSLLWVYEGQTQYWGSVLVARSGLFSQEDARDSLANTAAALDARAGRSWRNLQDTTNEPIVSAYRNGYWRDFQRSADYYDEARLIWLEADMLIREKTNGQRSLDDFARNFFGVEPKRVAPLPYTFDDVVRELNRVLPYEWAAFLRKRLDTHEIGAPLAGIRHAGWQLGWSEEPSSFFKAWESHDESTDFSYSLGLVIGKQDKLKRVGWGSPAFQAGLTQGATLLAVNGRAYKAELLKEALTAAKLPGSAPIELLVKTDELYRTVKVEWHDGLRYPKLVRIEGTPDRLTTLFTPLK